MSGIELLQQFGVGIGSAIVMGVALFRMLNARINSLKKQVKFSNGKIACMERFIEKVIGFIPEKKRNELADKYHDELKQIERDNR